MINALIVLYNKKINNSATYKSIKDYQYINIIVFDNSDYNYREFNKNYCNNNQITYYTLEKNVGLSKAYNYTIDRINKNKKDYILILDDDTHLNKSYISEAYNLILQEQFDIILPIVKSNNQIISPEEVQFNCRIKKIKNLDKINYNNISAINSGMIIRTEIFNTIRYNEEMFLDYIDHDFMKKVREYKLIIKIMKSSIYQEFSRNQKNDIRREKTRFNLYLKDFYIYCKNCNALLFYKISILKYKIHECKKYKTFDFLKIN